RLQKNLAYSDVQEKIAYKAKYAGIKVVKISPKYTSQRCSNCGYIAEGNRRTQEEFNCHQCGYKANADCNAANTIAIPDIEKRIKDELKRQEHERKMLVNA